MPLHDFVPAVNIVVAAVVIAGGGYLARVIRHLNSQMKNNGGSTLRDAVDRIERRQVSQERDLKHIKKGQKKQNQRLDALEAPRAEGL